MVADSAIHQYLVSLFSQHMDGAMWLVLASESRV